MDSLSVIFSALADPTRRGILARLSQGDASVGELAKPFDISAPAISRHIKVLERAELIERFTDAQWRRCRLKPEKLQSANKWIEQQQRFWTESFSRLDAIIMEQELAQNKNAGTEHE